MNEELMLPKDELPETIAFLSPEPGKQQSDITDIPSSTPTLLTTDMEIHKHPHHITHKKKWGEYLLEFIMLFLAVFLGFVAENYREHIVETEKAKQYMHTMVENLKYDTTRCNRNIQSNMEIAKGIDSFRFEIKEAINGRINSNKLYYFYKTYGTFFNRAVFNRAAISQLQSSGSLRLVKNDELATEVLDYYDRKIAASELAVEKLGSSLVILIQTYKLFFNWQYFDEQLTTERIFTTQGTIYLQNLNRNILKTDPPLVLLDNNPRDFEKLYNDVALYEYQIRTYHSYLRWAKGAADTLIVHIDEIYNFKKE